MALMGVFLQMVLSFTDNAADTPAPWPETAQHIMLRVAA